jgi:tetratricopeptide (TPR) repeat protein
MAAALAKQVEQRPQAEALARTLRSGEAMRASKTPDVPSVGVAMAKDYLCRGVSLLKQRRFDDAIHEFQAALRIDPRCTEAHCRLGEAYFAQVRVEDAICEFQAALRIDPSDAAAHCHLGKVYYMQGYLAEAIHEFQIALRIRPDYAEARASLGLVYGFQGRLGEAASEYEIALSVEPNNAQWHYLLSTIYAQQGHPEAVREMQIAAQLGFEPAKTAFDRTSS